MSSAIKQSTATKTIKIKKNGRTIKISPEAKNNLILDKIKKLNEEIDELKETLRLTERDYDFAIKGSTGFFMDKIESKYHTLSADDWTDITKRKGVMPYQQACEFLRKRGDNWKQRALIAERRWANEVAPRYEDAIGDKTDYDAEY